MRFRYRRSPTYTTKVEARLAYGTRPDPKVTLSYDELWELFKYDSNRFAKIALMCGVSRQAIQQIYNKYFARFFPKKKRTGRVRLKRSIVQKKLKRQRVSVPNTPAMRYVYQQARVEGLKFRCYITSTNTISTKLCFLDDQLCNVRFTNKKTNGYFGYSISRSVVEQCKYGIYCAQLDSGQIISFIVSRKKLLETWPGQSVQKYLYFSEYGNWDSRFTCTKLRSSTYLNAYRQISKKMLNPEVLLA